MSGIEGEDLKNEWSILQNQSDSYEKYSLLIKLVNIGLLSAAYISGNISIFVVFLSLILWVQDAIWKTYQSRIKSRLLQIENCLLNGIDDKSYQFHTDYHKNRPGSIALVGEYIRQAVKPTVAFPHVALVLVFGLLLINNY